jgi:release factor glutamine methyltransferase
MPRSAAQRLLASAFRDAGLETPELDARRLLEGVLGIDPLQRLADGDRPIGRAARALSDAAARRLSREPVSRILGRRAFYGRDFLISAATLDPRPDSEVLIDVSKALLERSGVSAPRIVDIGTGSGCLLLTLLAECPGATGIGVDLSQDALATARGNARRMGLDGRAAWVLGSMAAAIGGPVDLLISNPPYIATADLAHLDPEVTAFDPPVALDGGPDGLAAYRVLAGDLASVVPSGAVVLEVGATQASAVVELVQAAFAGGAGLDIELHRDLAGWQRCVAARARS